MSERPSANQMRISEREDLLDTSPPVLDARILSVNTGRLESPASLAELVTKWVPKFVAHSARLFNIKDSEMHLKVLLHPPKILRDYLKNTNL
jgi:hypothetical protein